MNLFISGRSVVTTKYQKIISCFSSPPVFWQYKCNRYIVRGHIPQTTLVARTNW